MTDSPRTPAHERAGEQQLDTLLNELAGVGPSPDLGARIEARLRDAAPQRPATLADALRQWMFAAVVVAGVGVVATVAWLRHDAQQAPATVPHEPAPKPQLAPEPTRAEAPPIPPRKWTTLIADYSDNRVVEIDDTGQITLQLDEVFGAWDVEQLANSNLLITEFSVSRVKEVDRTGRLVWAFEDLKNPYDADRLPNGNTLIADTFAGRVIEVDKAGTIVWSFATDIRPFDCDRLANGNTLIADVLRDRVIEVNQLGQVVWELNGVTNCHDADRLPNGNTLVTLRNKGCVREYDRFFRIVFELRDLSCPSDADRLPNGNTLVAENTRVREFDKDGNEVWTEEMTWAVEANRYYR
ncbi:MAG TPA: aryl-sulfate sulfotransferase [Planctomycetota bacterium]|nr:aryl-sulfate sulfotransferase [Planctomycetota bacterium]